MAVAHFIPSEMLLMVFAVLLFNVLATMRVLATISVAAVIVIIYVTPEIAVTPIPRSGSDEDSTAKPLGAVVAVRSAIVRWVIEIAVGAYRRRSNLH